MREPDDTERFDLEADTGDRARIVNLLGPTPIGLIRLASAAPATVRVLLLELELAGRLERHGGMVSLV